MLKMKKKCLACSDSLLHSSTVYICSYECTYCEACANKNEFVCKNCGGELKERPRREKSLTDLILSKLKIKN
jgi:hypothetical protein